MSKKIKDKFNILIIEDEIEVAQILQKYLSLYAPFDKFVIAKSSMEATQKLSNQEFDLIVSDLQLEKRSALEFIERVRSQPKYYNVKFMVVSGCVTREATFRLMRLGVRHILVKPFTARQILTNAISCLGIERRPEKTVNKIIEQVTSRLQKQRAFLEEAIPDESIEQMLETIKKNHGN